MCGRLLSNTGTLELPLCLAHQAGSPTRLVDHVGDYLLIRQRLPYHGIELPGWAFQVTSMSSSAYSLLEDASPINYEHHSLQFRYFTSREKITRRNEAATMKARLSWVMLSGFSVPNESCLILLSLLVTVWRFCPDMICRQYTIYNMLPNQAFSHSWPAKNARQSNDSMPHSLRDRSNEADSDGTVSTSRMIQWPHQMRK